jgi:hypothetical protein
VLFESVCIEMFEVAAPFRIILCRFQAILGKDAVNLVTRHLVPPAFSIEGASRSSAAAERRRGIFPHNKTSFDVAPEIAPRGNDYLPPKRYPFSIVVGHGGVSPVVLICRGEVRSRSLSLPTGAAAGY